MHHAAALPNAAEGAEQVDAAPIPTTPDDLLVNLQAPVPIENVRALARVRDGVNLEISYDLPDVGRVSVAVHAQDDGSGRGVVRVGDAVAVASEAADLSDLRPAQAHAVAASVLQIWREPAVTKAYYKASGYITDKCNGAQNS